MLHLTYGILNFHNAQYHLYLGFTVLFSVCLIYTQFHSEYDLFVSNPTVNFHSGF